MVARFLKDEDAKRRFWVGFFIIAVIGGVITYFSVNGGTAPSKRRGGAQMVVKNLTYYDVDVDADLYNPLGKPYRVDFSVPAGTTKTYEHLEGAHIRLGRRGDIFHFKFTKVADASYVIMQDVLFDGYEGDYTPKDEVRIKRRWDDTHWLVLLEEI